MGDQSDQAPSIQRLETIDQATLTPLVRRAVNNESCEIIDWDYKPIYGGAGDQGKGLSGIYRFAGRGRAGRDIISWSLILKVIGSPAQGGDPQGGTRERLAYQSGILNKLSGNLVAARCFDVVEQAEGIYWVWLEEVIDEVGPHWSLERYSLVAYHLGQFNGAYLTKRSLPDWPWLSQDWLRTLITPNASAITQLGNVLDHPLVSRRYPADVASGLFRLWADCEMFLAALDRLPQTFCHRDAWSRNLFVRRDKDNHAQTVAIDWAFVGIGAVGEEIAALTQMGTLFHPEEAQVLDAIVFNSYLNGLRDAGWGGDPKAVRFGYAASSALRYGLGFVAIGVDRLLNFDESKAAWVKQVADGRSIEELSDLQAGLSRILLKLADEARTLLSSFEPGTAN